MSLTLQDYLTLIQQGLPLAKTAPRRVIIVGAGMAGLVAAYELLRAGHDPLLLEAQQRVGGRLCTLREPFSPGLYADVGAMRIPRSHRLTMAYVERFGLSTVPFRLHNPRCYYYLYGQRYRVAEIEAQPDLLDFAVAPTERGQTSAQLWDALLSKITRQLEQLDVNAWEPLLAEYDRYSVREFLEKAGWSEGAIERFGLLYNQESLMNSSFLEMLREEIGHYYTDLVHIVGGTDRLPNAFLPALQERIRFGARMTAIQQTPDTVTVHYQTAAGPAQITGDQAILALPFSVLRHTGILTPFSRAKQHAIRTLHHDSATKVYLQCRRRFWESDDGIDGGWTITDLPARNLYYMPGGQERQRGMLLASYTWGQDAQRWGALSPADRVALSIENVAQIHPQVRDEFEVGASKVWDQDEYACGAFALFEPRQQALLYRHIIAPEGRIHFAGEHASLTHGWIQGAIESGLRAAWEVQQE